MAPSASRVLLPGRRAGTADQGLTDSTRLTRYAIRRRFERPSRHSEKLSDLVARRRVAMVRSRAMARGLAAMMRSGRLLLLGLAAGLVVSAPARAADHRDGTVLPNTAVNGGHDINDLYVF